MPTQLPTHLQPGVTPWQYTTIHYELVHNLVTDRYGWLIAETGQIEAWYADKDAALAAHPPTGSVTFTPTETTT